MGVELATDRRTAARFRLTKAMRLRRGRLCWFGKKPFSEVDPAEYGSEGERFVQRRRVKVS